MKFSLLTIIVLFLLTSYGFAETKTYRIDLNNDGKNEIITLTDNFDTQAEGLVTVFTPANKEIGSISMPDHLGKVEFISLNHDGIKQIIAYSYGGAHYTNIAIYGYNGKKLYKIFEDGSACDIETDFKADKPLIKLGRANWNKKGWCYADEPLWQIYTWNGKKFAESKVTYTTVADETIYPKDLPRFENFNERELEIIQKEVDEGHQPWRSWADYYAKFFMNFYYPTLSPTDRENLPAELRLEGKQAVVKVSYANKEHTIYLHKAFPSNPESIWIVEKMKIK